ncbi:putative VQ motif-containing protein [Helianthus annuus]|nr:putative VQ motif-containing protein [Helianthus annuus]
MNSGNSVTLPTSTVAPAGDTITDPISSLLNPNPTFFDHVNYDPTFTGFGAVQNDVFLHSQPPVISSHANTGQDSGTHHVGVSIKNPKKRTRASRRTPTTVLTTDTTNFRQMVQEFTGIPAAPFSAAASSPFSRRLDVFSGGGSGRGSMFPTPPVTQGLLDTQNPIFGFQSLLQTKRDDLQMDVSSCSTRNDGVDKLSSLCFFDNETERGLETGCIKRQ